MKAFDKKRFARPTALLIVLTFLIILSFGLPSFSVSATDKIDPGTTVGSQALSPSVFAVQEDGTSLIFSISVGEYEIRDDCFEFYGNVPVSIEGLPIVPSIVELFVIPDDMSIVGAEVIEDVNIRTSFMPKVHVPVAKTPLGSKSSVAQIQPGIDASLFPAAPFKILEAEPLKEYSSKLCYFVLYPAQCDLSVDQTIVHEKLTVRVRLAASEKPVVREESPFIVKAEALYGSLDSSLWTKGQRSAQKNVNFDSLIVMGEAYSAMAVPLCVRWTDSAEYRYGIIISPETTEVVPEKESENYPKGISKSEAEAMLQQTGYNRMIEVTDKDRLLDLILSEWVSSNGLIVSSSEMSHYTCAIASYLDWPLYVFDSSSDAEKIEKLTEMLNVKVVIAAGCNLSFDGTTITVNSEEQANALLYTIQDQTGFSEKIEHPEDGLMQRVLNPPTEAKSTGFKAVTYLILYSTYDISSSSIDILRAYRSATSVSVEGVTPARRIHENYVSYYSPVYLALVGDGDYWETDQFFPPDPTPDPDDPAYAPTDFFYEERTAVTYSDSNYDGRIESVSWPSASGTYSWYYDSIVGRVMCYDDASFQTYVQMLNDYEHGRLSPTHYRWLAFLSYFCKPGAATWDVHDQFVNNWGFLTWHAIHHDTTHGGCPSDYTFTAANTYFEFDTSNNIHYFNTHGSHTSITISRTNDKLFTSDVPTHHPPTNRPTFMWVDACLTASLGNEINSGYFIYFPENADDDTCIGCRFLPYGGLGYLGSSLLAYLGDFDDFDRALAYEMRVYPGQSIAESIAWARARYYSATGGGDAYTKKTVLEINFFGDPMVKLWWDVNSPTGSISINSGATYTTSTSVTLGLSASDTSGTPQSPSGVGSMRFSNDGSTWSAWESYATSKSWTLLTGDGVKTVYVQFRDNAGLISSFYTDTIILDTVAPTGSITINSGNPTYTTTASVTLYLTYFDATSGVDKVRYSNDGVWDTEPWETPAATKAWTLTAGDGTKTVYYQIKDKAGLLSTTYSDTIILDTVAPVTTISHAPGSSSVSLSATDATSGVLATYYRIDLGSWITYTGPFTLTGTGSHKIDYYSQDKAGNNEATKGLKVHYLTVNTDPAGITTISGTGWYDQGTTATTGTAPTTVTSGGVVYTFSTWKKDGTPVGGNPISVLMDAPHTATAVYLAPTASFTIWTNKTTYKIGETMKVYVRVKNPGAALPVRALIWLKLPSGAIYGPLLNMTTTLPANFDSGNVTWQTFTIPSAPLGTYAWIAELRNPTTGALISQSTWAWTLTATSTVTPTAKVILQTKPE